MRWIKYGDRVKVQIQGRDMFWTTVLYVPEGAGDCWIFADDQCEGGMLYVQQLIYVFRPPPKESDCG